MGNFGLVVIGAHSGVWLKSLFEQYQNQNILLVEPVLYNITLLKKNISKYKNIKIIRPGVGLEPIYFDKILGKKSKKNLKRGTPFKKEFY